MKNSFLAAHMNKKASDGTSSGRRGSKTNSMVNMIVIGLVLMIGGIIIFSLFKRTKRNTAYIDLLNIGDAIELYALENENMPIDLQTLWHPADETSKLYLDWEPIDPWGNPYFYHVNEVSGYELKSLGADGRHGGDDEAKDITLEEAKAEIQERSHP